MIHHWRRDEGGSYFEPSVKTAWRCIIYARDFNLDLERWFLDQGAVDEIDYDLDKRYNSGNPAYFISIYREDIAAAFLLRWKDNEN
jgi:hypothetical protein